MAETDDLAVDEEGPKVWAVKLGGALYEIRELPLAVINRIAKEHDVNWFFVTGLPLTDGDVGEALLRATAEQHALREYLPEVVTPKNILTFFEQVPDDLPIEPAASSDPPTGAAT